MNTVIIPESLRPLTPILQLYLDSLLCWFSQYVYDRLLAKAQEHELYRLQSCLDVGPIVRVCGDYHHRTGPGRKPVHTVPRLVRALVVKYVYGYSLRQLEQQLRFNLLVKWFVGYEVFAASPDHNTLHNFERYLYSHHPRLYFDTVLKQIDEQFPCQRRQSQIGDTFALRADAALEGMIERIRHTGCRLLWAIRAVDEERYELLQAARYVTYLLGQEEVKPVYYLSADEWQDRLEYTIKAVLLVQQMVGPASSDPAVATWLSYLEKLLQDELALDLDEYDRLLGVALLPEEKRGSYRICSATDPEATIRNHGPGKQDFGYNISITATPDFIREVRADTGSQPDAVAIPDLLQAQRDHHNLCPPKLIYDQAAGTGKAAIAVTQVSQGQTQLVAKPMPLPTHHPCFLPQDFSLSADEQTLTCPAGRLSDRRSINSSGGHTFRFATSMCTGCHLLLECRGHSEPPITPRQVLISSTYVPYQQLLTYSQTPAFKQDMKLRPHIERVIAGLVRHNGARRARFRGLAKVDFQVKMCAMAYNIKRWIKQLPSQIPHYRMAIDKNTSLLLGTGAPNG